MLLVVVFVVLISGSSTTAQLSANFYASSCPNALSIIKSGVTTAVGQELRMGASLLRLHFHDCFVNGCDASVLLDDTTNFVGEKTAAPNNNSLRGFNVIDTIKTQLETACPNVVSCADILAVAARDSVVALGGSTWNVVVGRRDSTTASFSAANTNLPGPNFNLSQLISSFSSKGLTSTDLVALSGAHSIGQAACANFRRHIYNDTNIDPGFANSLKANCPASGGDSNLAYLDATTPTTFDNAYYGNLITQTGLLHSDQELFNGGSTNSLVTTYASNVATFFSDFGTAMVKMGNLSPLTGSNGQIRVNCRKAN